MNDLDRPLVTAADEMQIRNAYMKHVVGRERSFGSEDVENQMWVNQIKVVTN